MSNTERQRRFRERNPGYYGRLRRRRTVATATPVDAAVVATPDSSRIATATVDFPPMAPPPPPLSGMAFAPADIP